MVDYSRWDKINVSDSDSDDSAGAARSAIQLCDETVINRPERSTAHQEGAKARTAGRKVQKAANARKKHPGNSAQTVEQQDQLHERAELIAAQLMAEEEAEKRARTQAKARKKKATSGARNASPSAAARDPPESSETQQRPARFEDTFANVQGGDSCGFRTESLQMSGFDSAEWNTVSRPKVQPRLHRDFDLAGWKTSKCILQERHDSTSCKYFHEHVNDRRRDPFTEFYLPEDAANKVEEMYHPVNFRTKMCIFKSCKFKTVGKNQYVCAFAHDEKDLRVMSEGDYASLPSWRSLVPQQATKLLQEFVPQASTSAIPELVCAPGPFANEPGLPLTWVTSKEHKDARPQEPVFLPLDPFQACLVAESAKLWSEHLHKMANLYCCRLQRAMSGDCEGLRITGEGEEAQMLKEDIYELLYIHPPKDIVSCDRTQFSTRVLKHVETMLTREELGDKYVWVQIKHKEMEVVVHAIRSRSKPQAGKDVLSKISFWIGQQGLDKFVQCCCCYEEINHDQGVGCPNGHYFCVHDGNDHEQDCMTSLIEDQIPAIKAQKEALLCPLCKQEFVLRQIASRVSDTTFGKLQKAIMDSKIECQTAALQQNFDARLQQKVDELLAKFSSGDISELVKEKGKAGAAEARNQALNLSCPHEGCKAVYGDFEGCMALQCGSCKKFFCGFCHKPASSSRGCHEHVRECDMNLTRNASYYADQEIIKEAQKRYRIKKLKQFLRSDSNKFKKDVQNAIIIELKRDLEDLGIDPKALFDVGNLQ